MSCTFYSRYSTVVVYTSIVTAIIIASKRPLTAVYRQIFVLTVRLSGSSGGQPTDQAARSADNSCFIFEQDDESPISYAASYTYTRILYARYGHIYVSVCMYVCVCVCVCVFVCMYVCMYLSIYLFVYVRIYLSN